MFNIICGLLVILGICYFGSYFALSWWLTRRGWRCLADCDGWNLTNHRWQKGSQVIKGKAMWPVIQAEIGGSGEGEEGRVSS